MKNKKLIKANECLCVTEERKFNCERLSVCGKQFKAVKRYDTVKTAYTPKRPED